MIVCGYQCEETAIFITSGQRSVFLLTNKGISNICPYCGNNGASYWKTINKIKRQNLYTFGPLIKNFNKLRLTISDIQFILEPTEDITLELMGISDNNKIWYWIFMPSTHAMYTFAKRFNSSFLACPRNRGDALSNNAGWSDDLI